MSSKLRNIKLTLEYQGTLFHGWQIQPNQRTVQGELKKAIETIVREKIKLIGASRTDAGVHALGQVANFYTTSPLPLWRLKEGINALVGKDISVVDIEEVELQFNARFSAKGKIYVYQIWQGYSPLRRYTHWMIPQKLNIEAMREAAEYLKGKHNFNAFRASDCDKEDPYLELRECKIITNCEGNQIGIIVEAPFFLKNMVRIIAGTLLYIGKGKITPQTVKKILNSGDRSLAGPTAPPHGLILYKVLY